MKKILTIWLSLLLALLTFSSDAQAPAWAWATTPGLPIFKSNATDAAGNVYVTGLFTDTARFGSTTLISAGFTDVFVAKLNSHGTYEWAVKGGKDGPEAGTALAVDASGNVLLLGAFGGKTTAFGTATLVNADTAGTVSEMFVAKLSPTGTWLWATSAQGIYEEVPVALSVDATGNATVSGQFYSPTLSCGSTVITNASQSNPDLFVARVSPAGMWLWATGAGGANSEVISGLAVDGAGNAFLTGYFYSATATFGATTLTNASTTFTNDLFVARLSAAGAWQWAVRAGSAREEISSSIALDAAGDAYITGSFDSTVTFGTTLLHTNGLRDLFVARLTGTTGAWQWATSGGSPDFCDGNSIAISASGQLVIGGDYSSNSITFGTTTLTNNGGYDGFIGQMSPAGVWQWALSPISTSSDFVSRLVLDGNSNAYLLGAFSGDQLTFGTTSLTPAPTKGQSYYMARLGTSTLGLAAVPDAEMLALAPNPATTTVQLTAEACAPITLLDALGRVVRTATMPATGNLTLAVRGLPAGLYTVRAGKWSQRLVVE